MHSDNLVSFPEDNIRTIKDKKKSFLGEVSDQMQKCANSRQHAD